MNANYLFIFQDLPQLLLLSLFFVVKKKLFFFNFVFEFEENLLLLAYLKVFA